MKHPITRACAVLAALGLALAGCGGGDREEAAPTAAETAVLAADARLDEASWDQYVETREQASAVNEEAIATFRSCRDLLGTEVPADEVEQCLGTAAADVVAEGREVLAVLDGLSVEPGGACADATAELSGNVKLYTSSVNAILLTVQRGSLPTSQDVGASAQMLIASREAAAEFEQACKPL